MQRHVLRFVLAVVGVLPAASTLVAQGGPPAPGTSAPNEGLHRTIQEDRVTQGNGKGQEPPQQAVPSGAAMNTVLSSTGDLNSIRDAYLRRLAGDGCAPDVAVRVAQLRARLHQEASGTGALESNVEIEAALLALASDWYKNPLGESLPAAGSKVASSRESERVRLLDAALAPRDRAAAPAPQIAETPQALQAELDRLLAGCRSAVR